MAIKAKDIRYDIATIIAPFSAMHHINFDMMEATLEMYLDSLTGDGELDDYHVWWDIRRGTPYFCAEFLMAGSFSYEELEFKFERLTKEEIEDESSLVVLVDNRTAKTTQSINDAYDRAMRGI